MIVPAEKPKKVVTKIIAIVVHQEQSRPGRVGVLLEKRGYELHRPCLNLGCNLPEDMSDDAGVVIFGGPMSANDCGRLGWHQVRARLDPQGGRGGRALPRSRLGAQLLTRAVGGRVSPHPEGKIEVGYVDIEPTEAGRAWFKGPMKVYQWHREGMDVPGCCELLATNDTYPVQAFRCGPNAFGFQFHPEVTLADEGDLDAQFGAPEATRRPAARRASQHARTLRSATRPLDRRLPRSLAGDRYENRFSICEICPARLSRNRRRCKLAA